ncbi:MAG: transketolase [Deltaproteobacteria bacterium]|nr:MAG: transketolase [Deltaproteobacteria bacterium]
MTLSTAMANAIRILSMDSIQAANSGHPGAPMGLAEVATALWSRHLRHNPADPGWINRDRFVLSNGHGSMLLYSLLHLTGYALSLDELKRFRQLHSKTPGHPEYGYTPGVETTTGPLGQGLANAVGMALAERLLAAEFNREGFPLFDHFTYVILGDGCMMEGISHEACSLAGTWKLNKLIALYDDNGISIDGAVEGWFTDDTPTRFEAYGWQVLRDVDGHDVDAVDRAIAEARKSERPTLICCRTVIGKGSPNKAGSHQVHGAPLGEDEVAATRKALGAPEISFTVDDEVAAAWDARRQGDVAQQAWEKLFASYEEAYPQEAAEIRRRIPGDLPENFASIAAEGLAGINAEEAKLATRKASQKAINVLAPLLPEFLGGSADLAPSNLTQWQGCTAVGDTGGGNYIHYGVREFAMGAIMNGLCLHGGFRPFAGTFLIFSEYMRNAIRMAALMRLNPIYVFTHDSVGVGEDGPTHQPVEQTATLRLIPNLDVWRPCDAVETFVAWQTAVEHRETPTALILSRQGLPHQDRDADKIAAIRRGGYVLADTAGEPDVVLIATGSEVALAMGARVVLASRGLAARVVSMPSLFIFDQQEQAYRDAVLGTGIPRVAVEAGVGDGWYRYVGLDGRVVCIDRFGESGPAAEVFAHLGLTEAAVVEAAEAVIRR